MNNNTSDDNLEKVLDDIFGNDFLEIELDNDKVSNNTDEPLDNKINEEHASSLLLDNDPIDNAVNINETNTASHKENSKELVDKKSKNKNKKSINIFSILLIGLIIIILGLIAVYLPGYLENKEYVVNCSYSASVKGYKITDEYKITYKKDKIEYLDGKYKYTALTDEYKQQIEYVKNEKLPAIINSNGMDGFTYIYEASDDYFSVDSYLDITKFDFNTIDKNDNKKNPLSYVNINSKTTYKSLIEYFEKNGYKCTKSR